MKTIETPYGKKTPELLCKAMDAYEREPALTAALDQAVGALERAIIDGRLQTFEDRETFRIAARAALATAKKVRE